MDDQLKVWTSVGSAGTLNQADLAKVSLQQSVVQLGTAIEPPPQPAGSAPRAGAVLPTEQAVVRYNVTPVDGLLFAAANFRYHLQIRYRGRVTARLMEVDLESGAENQVILFDSSSFPTSPNFQQHAVPMTQDSTPLDFVNKGYYVEATMTTSAVATGSPAAISIVKVFASPNFSG
jgi:hypothetical protein